MEPVEPVQMNIYHGKDYTYNPIEKIYSTYRKDLSWLNFDDEPRVQERQQVKDQQSCISVFVAYLTIPISNLEHQPRTDNSILCMAVW